MSTHRWPQLVTKLGTTTNSAGAMNKANWSFWALTSLEGILPYATTIYKTGHHFRGEKEACKKQVGESVKLGTKLGTPINNTGAMNKANWSFWSLCSLEGVRPCATTTYQTGHHFQGEKEAYTKQVGSL
jgi:hypothetical protein